jgi:carboxymethylenebutenolidase
MCDLNDQEELKKYTRRDFSAWVASASVLTALPSVVFRSVWNLSEH